jgi:hypothetical protein
MNVFICEKTLKQHRKDGTFEKVFTKMSGQPSLIADYFEFPSQF